MNNSACMTDVSFEAEATIFVLFFYANAMLSSTFQLFYDGTPVWQWKWWPQQQNRRSWRKKSLAIYYHLHCRFPNCIANLELNSSNTAELMTD